jgi:Pvc16 N-terminal domain/IPT/TIG domain
MSNFLAVATVTATLQRQLHSVIAVDVAGAAATTVRPDAPGRGVPAVGVNIFLYEIAPNAVLRNVDLPTRSGNGQATQRPVAALDLHYLMSFYGEDDLGAQRVLGSVVRHLHSHPLLTRQMIQDTVSDPAYLYLATSNLAGAVDFVRFSPLSLSLEELSKLWSIFFQTPYALSAAYRASVVFIEEELTTVTPLPVRERQLFVVPFQQPFIESVDPQIVAVGATLTITGQNLRGDVTKIKFGDALATPAAPDVSNERIKIALPGALQPGVRTAQVIGDFDFRTGIPGNEPHHGFQSNAVPFVLSPTITIVNATSTTVTVKFVPNVGKTQRVKLVLNELNPPTTRPEHDYTFDAPEDNGITDPAQNDTDTVAFAIEAVAAGDYLVRVRVDDAESLPDVDNNKNSPTFGQYLGTPKITIP